MFVMIGVGVQVGEPTPSISDWRRRPWRQRLAPRPLQSHLAINKHSVDLWKKATKSPLAFSLNLDVVNLVFTYGELTRGDGGHREHLKYPFHDLAIHRNLPKSCRLIEVVLHGVALVFTHLKRQVHAGEHACTVPKLATLNVDHYRARVGQAAGAVPVTQHPLNAHFTNDPHDFSPAPTTDPPGTTSFRPGNESMLRGGKALAPGRRAEGP